MLAGWAVVDFEVTGIVTRTDHSHAPFDSLHQLFEHAWLDRAEDDVLLTNDDRTHPDGTGGQTHLGEFEQFRQQEQARLAEEATFQAKLREQRQKLLDEHR